MRNSAEIPYGLDYGGGSFMEMSMAQSTALEEVTEMLDDPGMEVFANIPEMPEIAAEIIQDAQPGKSVFVGIAGIPRTGKKHILGGLVHVLNNSETLRGVMAKAGSKLEIWCAKSADGYREAQRRGHIDPQVPWGHWSIQDSDMASALLEQGVNWALDHRRVGELTTKVVLFSGVGVLDVNPQNPTEKITRYKSNIGSSVHQTAGERRSSRLIFPIGNETVRQENHDFFMNLEEVIDDEQKTADLLATHHVSLDDGITARDLLRDGASAFGMERVSFMYYRNMVSLGGGALGTRPFTEEELHEDADLRAFVEKQYLEYLGEGWGYSPENIHVVDNTQIISHGAEQQRMKHYLGGLLQRHTIPLASIPDIRIPYPPYGTVVQ